VSCQFACTAAGGQPPYQWTLAEGTLPDRLPLTAAGVPLNLRAPFYSSRGFAGRNDTTGSDPTNPSASGGDSLDADGLAVPGRPWIRFIKFQSTGDSALTDDFRSALVRHTAESNALGGLGSSGFDLGAVSAVNY
jgi:hypothetical protein